jgi:hypothetical protein
MSRKQKALEERYKKPPKAMRPSFKTIGPEFDYNKARQAQAAKEQERRYYEENRGCTLAEVMSSVNSWLGEDDSGRWVTYSFNSFYSGGIWGFDTPKKWEEEVRSIVYAVKYKEFNGNKYTGTHYSEEYKAFVRESAAAEFNMRRSPLYQLL